LVWLHSELRGLAVPTFAAVLANENRTDSAINIKKDLQAVIADHCQVLNESFMNLLML
jgi:hypothetical protein